MKKLLIYIFLLFGFLFFVNSITKAACDPAECGQGAPNGNTCTSQQNCVAKCCIDPKPPPPPTPRPGGNPPPPPGYVPRTCGNGTTLVCGESPIGQNCVTGPTDDNRLCGPTPIRVVCRDNVRNCDNSFPSKFITRAQMAPAGTPAPRCGVGVFNSTIYNDYCQINCGCCSTFFNEIYTDGVGCVRPTPTCTVDLLPSVSSVAPSTVVRLNAYVPVSGTVFVGSVSSVNFSLVSGSAIMDIPSDRNPPYQTNVTSTATSVIKADVIMAGISICSDTATITVISPPAWWQVKDGDITTNNNISSEVPTGSIFDTDGSGGFPGVPVYGGGLDTGLGILSSKLWRARSQTIQSRVFNYTYFKGLIPDNITPTNALPSSTTRPTTNGDGYEWYRVTGNTTIGTVNFGNRKVILLVENGNLTINGNLNVNDGVGFFGAFVNGNITINPSVIGAPAIEGIYMSDGSFNTVNGNNQFHLRGSVAAHGGVNLGRDLTNNIIAAELFEYAPDQILLFPKKLAFRRTKWSEIAP